MKFAPGTWSYIAATIAIAGGSVNLVWDILSFDATKIMRLAYMMTGTLQAILLDIVTYITKLPSFVVKVSQTLLMLAKNNPFTGTILNVVMTAFRFAFPPMVHGLAAFQAVEQNKSVSYHYILPFIYSKTTVDNRVV